MKMGGPGTRYGWGGGVCWGGRGRFRFVVSGVEALVERGVVYSSVRRWPPFLGVGGGFGGLLVVVTISLVNAGGR